MAIRNFFALMRKSHGVFEKCCQKLTREWDLNNTSFQVFMFFANYPEYNTARDLCAVRGMKTGIASVAIDQLVSKGLLERRTDPNDRRLQRLYLTERASALAEAGNEIQHRFFNDLHKGMTEEELELYFALTMKLKKNVDIIEQNL